MLSDPEKKRVYDQGGLQALESRQNEAKERGKDMQQTIPASLEDLYNGNTTKVTVQRDRICTDCAGRGGKVGAEKECDECNGFGVCIQLVQIAPGFVQRAQVSCRACGGRGSTMREADKCKTCRGNKVTADRKMLGVNIEKGMKNGSKIRFAGEADEAPDVDAGDVIFVVQEKQHAVFKRKGGDLLTTVNLSLREALCGFTRTIVHLDGRVLKLSSSAGMVTAPESVRMIKDEGMPHFGNPFTKGRLFVKFNVDFPENHSSDVVAALFEVLPKVRPVSITGEEEECSLVPADIREIGSDGGTSGGRSAYEEDEDQDDGRSGGPGGVQCRNM